MGKIDEMKWFIKLLFGKKYFITYTDKLKEDEILVIGHRIYISKRGEKMKENNIIYFKFPWNRVAITQYYSSKHQAIDNSSKGNTYAFLPCDAKIVKNQWYDDYGYMVEYEASDSRGTFIMADGHFKKKSSLKIGQTYKMGTKIGEIGTTGNSTGPHDHFRIALNGKRVDPLDYLYVYDGQEVHEEDVPKVKYFNDVVKKYEIIVDKIPVYTNANNAKNHKKSTGTWGKGTYYVFNEAYGMINITTKVGTAGAWMNPADNVIKEEPVEPPKVEEEKPVEDTLNEDIENTEKEPITEEKPSETAENTQEEETTENKQENEEIEQDNIFVRIIKIIIDFIIGIFKR